MKPKGRWLKDLLKNTLRLSGHARIASEQCLQCEQFLRGWILPSFLQLLPAGRRANPLSIIGGILGIMRKMANKPANFYHLDSVCGFHFLCARNLFSGIAAPSKLFFLQLFDVSGRSRNQQKPPS
jgi:hypothetical protein